MHFRTGTAATIALALCASGALAQSNFPSRPISLVVATPPGGGTDTFARQIAEAAQPLFNQPVIVENKPGGSGTIGITGVLASKPDGYSLVFYWNGPLTSIPHSLPVAYTDKSYAAVMSIGYSAYVFCVKPDFPASSAGEFLDVIKQTPGKFTYGNDGAGGNAQLAAERIFAKVGAKARPVPFGGAGETARNFLGGHVDIYVGSLPTILPHVKAGKAKCLLLSSADQNPIMPAATGLKALGMGDEETVLWWGIIAPAKTPKPILEQLEATFLKAADTAKFKQTMDSQGAIWRLRGGADTAKLLQQEYAALGAVARAVGIARTK